MLPQANALLKERYERRKPVAQLDFKALATRRLMGNQVHNDNDGADRKPKKGVASFVKNNGKSGKPDFQAAAKRRLEKMRSAKK